MAKKNPGPTLTFQQLGEKSQIPPEFIAAMDITETSQPVPNDVQPDALSDTVIFSRIETNRTNERVKHTWFKKPGNITLLDVVNDQNGNPIQQTRILFPTGTKLPDYPDYITRVAVKDLGNGWSILEASVTGTYDDNGIFIASLYQGPIYYLEKADLLPEEFKTLVKTTEESIVIKQTVAQTIAIGTALINGGDLATGVLKLTYTQLDPYTARRETIARTNSTVATLTSTEYGSIPDGDGGHFSGILNVVKSFSANSIFTADIGFAIIESVVINLGTGQSVKTTKSFNNLTSPGLVTADFVTDDRGLVINRARALVTPGYLYQGGFHSVKTLDDERSVSIVEVAAALSIDRITALTQVYEGFIDIDVPPQLTAVEIKGNLDGNAGFYSETGSYSLGSGGGSGSLSLSGTARAAAGVALEVYPSITYPQTRNIPCMHYIFPVLRTTTYLVIGSLVTLWNFYFGATGGQVAINLNLNNGGVLPSTFYWPKFTPQQVKLSLSYGHGAVAEQCNVHASDSVVTDYTGAFKRLATIRTSGQGVQQEIELVQKVVILPPTIHGALTVINPNWDTGRVINSGSINVAGSGATKIFSAYAEASGITTPTTITATPNTNTIPVSGAYIYKSFVEYYKNDIMMAHLILVDFADVPR